MELALLLKEALLFKEALLTDAEMCLCGDESAWWLASVFSQAWCALIGSTSSATIPTTG